MSCSFNTAASIVVLSEMNWWSSGP